MAPGQKKPQRKFLGLVFQVHMDPNLPPGGNARNITSQLQGVVERPFLKGRSLKTPQRRNARNGFSFISIPTLNTQKEWIYYSEILLLV